MFAVLTYDDQSPAHTITIRDNDATPAVSIAADTPTVVEEQPAAFTLTRTGATGSPLTVTVAVSEQADRDLLPDGAATERTVRFGAGAATTALTVALENDRVAEPDGDLTVAVQAGAGYTPGAPSSATVTVEDGDTDTAPPTVTSVVVASTPHSGDTYRWGETIVFTVTFSEPVRVMGRPWLDVGLDNPAGASGSTVRAGFWGLSDDADVTSDSWPAPVSRHVHFGYSVQPFDIDDDGVRVGANALRLASGDRIQSDETDTYAEFAHAALALQSGHLVDGRTTVDGEPTVPVVEAGIRFVDTDGNPLELLANGTHRLSVPEGGEARYGLRLKTQPAHKVVVSHHYHTYGGDSDLTVPRNFSLDGSIRPDTWDTQTAWVRVAAAQDDDAEDGERVFDNRAFSRNPNYHDLVLPDVVVVEADDEAKGSSPGGAGPPLTAVFEGLPEAHDGATAFSFRLAFSEAVAVTPEAMRTRVLTVAGGAVTGAARVDGASGAWAITVTPDTREALSISLAPAAECAADGAVCTADGRALSIGAAHIVGGPGPDTGSAPLTATFPESVYASAQHKGPSDRPQVVVAFSAPVAAFGADTPSVSATGAAVDGVQRLDKEGLENAYVFFLTPEGHQAIVFRLHANRACTDGGICTADRRQLSNSPAATVSGPSDEPERNTAAAGAPAISGTPQVGEALTASTSDISDADGLDDARFAYQWIRTGADIGGATGSTYTPVAADEGTRLKVRVDFTDDAGNEESLTSAATDAVAAATEPLTASFSGVPGEHTGRSFTFGLRFSEDFPLSYKTLRDEAFSVSGGAVRGAKRKQQGSNQRWTITVKPDSHAPVTVSLPAGAVETSDGRSLESAVSATVAGPVGISVVDARVDEGEGALLAFAVTLDRAATGTVAVDYATADGTAPAGADYTATSGTLTFRAGESSQTIEVAVLDDSHDESEETLTLTLSNASGGRLTDARATGTIENTDPLPRAFMARFGRTAAVHVVEQVQERIEAPREVGFEAQFAGRQLRPGMVRELAVEFLSQLAPSAGTNRVGAGAHGSRAGSPVADASLLGTPGLANGTIVAADPMGFMPGTSDGLNPRGHFGRGFGGGKLQTGSAFVMNRETRRGGILSFWSRGAQSQFAGREGELSLGGRVRTTMFGADYAKGPLVTGLSLSHSRGRGGYEGVATGEVASAVTGLYPWLGYKVTDRITLWGVTGYGKGALTLTPGEGTTLKSGLSMAMAAGGLRGDLADSVVAGFGMAFKADALWVGTGIEGVNGLEGRLAATSAAVTRYRTALEASRSYRFQRGLSLQPSLEVGLRHDGGDAETGAGIDIGGGLIVSDALTGLSADVRVRMLLVHQDQGFRDRGVSLSFGYNPSPLTPFGFMAKLTPSWGGQATSGAQALWGQETMAGVVPGGAAAGGRLEAELGYGLPVGGRWVGMPSFGIGTSDYGRDYRVGYGLTVAEGGTTHFDLGVYANRRESLGQGTAEHGVLGRLTARW